ncbi:MAG: hypothetical protein ACM3U2_02035 [Deltaproteobacteria bacterium]
MIPLAVLFATGGWGIGQDQVPRSPLSPKTARTLVSPFKSAIPAADQIMPAAGTIDAGDADSDDENKQKHPPKTAEESTPYPEYPPDPIWPTWTPASDPSRQPIFAPAGQYDLVRPAHGILQTLDDQEFERVVASEDDLIYEEATCPPPIDLMRPDGMAPAGVFGDHTLNTGGRVLLSYRFNNTSYDGLLSGTGSVSNASVFNSFALAPTHETALTHYFVGEFGPTDDFTFQFILPVIQRRIQYVSQAGQHFVTDVTDLYDLQFNTMYVLYRGDRQQIHLNLGLRTPNGIFDQQGQFPTPTSPNLTYPMRTSDGTWDFLPGATYRGQSDYWTWGAQILGTKRFGKNRYDYRLGDDLTLNAWLSRKLTDSLSGSVRLNGVLWGNIVGADHRLNPNLVPTNRPDLQGGRLLNVLFGLNYVVPSGALRGQRLGVEGGIPAYQSLFGPQLQQRYQIWANVSLSY